MARWRRATASTATATSACSAERSAAEPGIAWAPWKPTALRRTPLYDGPTPPPARKLVPFAGWEMPVQYEGIRAEHQAVRERAGVFDVSHMGEIETRGPQARWSSCSGCSPTTSRKIAGGGAQYSLPLP